MARYEQLRAQALGGTPGGWRLGLAVLEHRGVVAWTRAWQATTPSPARAAIKPVAVSDELDSHVKEMGQNLVEGLATLNDTIKPLVRDADEMREVVEPLQTATERVGRLAERLPGPGRKR